MVTKLRIWHKILFYLSSWLALAFFCTLFSLEGELTGFKLGSAAGTGHVPALHQALCCTNATLQLGAKDTEVPKRKRGTFGTHLSPPLFLPDGDETTSLCLDLDGSRLSQLRMCRDGHLALFWHLPAALTSKGMVRPG